MGIFVITECLWEWWIIWAVLPEASGFVRVAGDCQWSSRPVWPYHSHYWTCSLSCSMRVGNKLLHGSSKQCRDQWEIILPDRCLCLVDPASTAKVKSWRLSSWAKMAALGEGKLHLCDGIRRNPKCKKWNFFFQTWCGYTLIIPLFAGSPDVKASCSHVFYLINQFHSLLIFFFFFFTNYTFA